MHPPSTYSFNLAAAALLLPCILSAQAASTPAKTPAFDIVSIRPSKSPGQPHFGPTPDGYQATNLSLTASILMAYMPLNGQSYYTADRIKGAPGWAQSERYDIEARVAEADLTAWHDPEQQKVMLRAMLQTLLADRSKLVVHRDTKEAAIFELVVAKSGPHLKPAVAAHPSGVSLLDGGTLVPGTNGQTLAFYGASMASLAQVLSNFAGRPVQDKTGLSGAYDFTLEREAADPATPGPPAYSIDALGLHLDRSRSIVDTLIIDHLERPTEN